MTASLELTCLTFTPDCTAYAGVPAETSRDGRSEAEGGARGVHRAGQHQRHAPGPPLRDRGSPSGGERAQCVLRA